MQIKLPNLELLEYIAKTTLKKDKEWMKKYKESMAGRIHNGGFNLVVYDMFLQTWGSTVTAFDTTDDGENVFGGQMLTEAYTVVFHERLTDVYIVFVDNKICYMVSNANDRFLKDVENKEIASLSMAGLLY